MQKRVIGKDRDISKEDWIILMQLEYISFKLRAELYRSHKDVKKFNDIAEKKKKVILDFVSTYNRPSIFNSLEMKDHLINQFFNEWGLPNFKYRDDYQRYNKVGRNRWDRCYYFKVGSEVKVKTDKSIKLGIIKKYDWENDRVLIDCINAEEMELDSIYVSRIFTKQFLKNLI